MQVVLSFGGNKNGTLDSFKKALVFLHERVGEVVLKSSVITTPAWGFEEKTNDFLNQIIVIETTIAPKELLKVTQKIEIELGRKPKLFENKYEDRVIDIDILFHENLILKTTKLTVPHKFVKERRFILEPMSEILPNFIHPVFNKTIQELLAELA